MKTSTKTSTLRIFAVACMIFAGFCFVAGSLASSVSDKGAANTDFIAYWSAGQQLRHGADPYNGEAILPLEKSKGLEGNEATNMRNPPTALFLVWPLGFVGLKTGCILWSLALLACLSLANWIVWLINGDPDSRLHLLGYLFAPTLACELVGQVGTFLLVGIMLFFYLQKSQPYLAGAALLFCTFKPHLFLPFFIVLTLWSVCRREFRILAGFGVALLASCTFAFSIDRHAFSQYSQMMRSSGIMNLFIPTLSILFRILIDRNAVWLQFVPEVFGCIWAIWYFWTRRSRWSWTEEGMLLLLVSAACTPYAWFTDETVLLPAVMTGLYCAVKNGRSVLPLVLFAAIALIEVLELVRITTSYYLWTVPAWLTWYLYATSGKQLRPWTADSADENFA